MNYLIQGLITVGGLLLAASYAHYLSRKAKSKDDISGKVESHGERITVVEADQRTLKKSIESLDTKIDKMPEKIVNLLSPKHRVIQKQSPPRLTPRGVSMSQESGIDVIIERNIDAWLPRLSKLDGYALFSECQNLVNEVFSDAANSLETAKIKDHFYQGGLDVETAKEVFVLRLRDIAKKNKV